MTTNARGMCDLSLSDALLSTQSYTQAVCMCFRQHMRNCTLTDSQLFQDILSYSLPLISCEATSSTSDISSATGKITS